MIVLMLELTQMIDVQPLFITVTFGKSLSLWPQKVLSSYLGGTMHSHPAHSECSGVGVSGDSNPVSVCL